MEKKYKVDITNQVPFFTVLFFVFLVLKLVGTITWSWWWVTAPLWGPVAFISILTLGFLICIFVLSLCTKFFG